MRKTTPYFAGKMRLMFRRNVMDWLKESMLVDKDEMIAKRRARIYYLYCSSSDIGTIFKDGRVISGFTLKNITLSDIKLKR